MAHLVKPKTKPSNVRKMPANRRKPMPVRSFQQPKVKKSLIRRILRLFFNPITFGIVAIMVLVAFLTATYFWFEFSDRIDLLLSGKVFTRNSGIYSAPKMLRKGETVTPEELVEYLRSAGYIKKENKADALRSRFELTENEITIEPGLTAVIDGKRDYRNLIVKFDKKGKSIASITDKDSEETLPKSPIEPQILSSMAAEGDGQRKVVTFKDLPKHLIDAITVTEDRAFFEHYGVNFRGVARALWRKYEGENGSPIDNQGGSSITQQLVKNLLLSSEQTYERKAREAYMSVILETRLSKEEIFTLYANQIYLGQHNGVSIYGVGEASNIYFGKDVSALTLDEAAFIAGIIRSPNRYNPYKNPKKTEQRRNQVLDSMVEAKAISRQKADEAQETELILNEVVSKKDLLGMPYFSQYAVEQLPKVVNDPEALQHSRVYTTIDPDLQSIAYKTVSKRLSRLEKYYKNPEKRANLNASLVAIRPKTGEIVAMIGGKNYQENQFNRATSAMRQPGSVFKPFVYATAINTAHDRNSRVLTAASLFKDEKKVFNFNDETYSPNNYGDFFSNQEITMRDALMKSKNVITVDLAMELNVGKVMNLAHKAGLPKVERAYPSMALGTAEATPLQMAEAYTAFANLGDKVSPIAINRVTTGEGKTIATPTGEKKNILRDDVAYIMNDMMKDVINKGTAAEAKAWGFTNVEGKRGYAGKTGTSRDGWFVGFTPELVVAVYVGFDNGDDLGMKGSDSAMPIWAEFMREALRLHPEWNGDWKMPVTIRKAEIDTRTGKLIRELTDTEAASVDAQQEVIEKNKTVNAELDDPNLEDLYVSNIPLEFRRIELFISGTVPNKMLVPLVESTTNDESKKPDATPTPFTTWEDAQKKDAKGKDDGLSSVEKITIMYCPISGKKANKSCPTMQSKTFLNGTEPKDFCKLHVSQTGEN